MKRNVGTFMVLSAVLASSLQVACVTAEDDDDNGVSSGGGSNNTTNGGNTSSSGGTATSSGGGNQTDIWCCLNGAFYSCPDQDSVLVCAQQWDPSGCTRQAARDAQCGSTQPSSSGNANSGPKPGDTCTTLDGCGSNMMCVQRPNDSYSTCRVRCQTWGDCRHSNLSFHACCPVSGVMGSVCIPDDTPGVDMEQCD